MTNEQRLLAEVLERLVLGVCQRVSGPKTKDTLEDYLRTLLNILYGRDK